MATAVPALQVQHADGDQNMELQVTDYNRKDEGSAVIHTFTMQDKLLPVTVKCNLLFLLIIEKPS